MTLLGLDLAAPYPPELCYLTGAVLILLGWVGWRRGCRRPTGPTLLLVRHPQYLGVLLIALGLFVRWATLPFMSLWLLLLLISSWVCRAEPIQGRAWPPRDPARVRRRGGGSLPSRFHARRP